MGLVMTLASHPGNLGVLITLGRELVVLLMPGVAARFTLITSVGNRAVLECCP